MTKYPTIPNRLELLKELKHECELTIVSKELQIKMLQGKAAAQPKAFEMLRAEEEARKAYYNKLDDITNAIIEETNN